MTQEMARYIVAYYVGLMRDVEHKAYSHLGATMKATQGRSDLAAQQEARTHSHFGRFLSHDPVVLSPASDGYDPFVLRTATRILTENPDRVRFNHCPKCGALARTPNAKQCRVCGFDWH